MIPDEEQEDSISITVFALGSKLKSEFRGRELSDFNSCSSDPEVVTSKLERLMEQHDGAVKKETGMVLDAFKQKLKATQTKKATTYMSLPEATAIALRISELMKSVVRSLTKKRSLDVSAAAMARRLGPAAPRLPPRKRSLLRK